MYPVAHILIVTALLLFVSVLASKLSGALGIPTLLFFLIIGMLASRAPIESTLTRAYGLELAKFVGILTLILVLFFGGLETDFAHIRPILGGGVMLSTLGALITAVVVGVFLQWMTQGYLGFAEGLLVGAIVASTDAAAVFSILNSRNLQLKAHIAPILELESGVNDVIVYFLMSFLLNFIRDADTLFFAALPIFFQEMLIGTLGGLALGYVMRVVINAINLPYVALYPLLAISMVLLGYGVVDLLHGSGFLAVYVSGVILGNSNFIQKKNVVRFYEGFSWLMNIIMFVIFGMLVVPAQMRQVVPWGIQLSGVLILLARPLSVFIALLGSRFTFKQKLFIAWVGLRGAVPIIFATYLYVLPGPKADVIFHLIFFIVFVSIALQGTTLYPMARLLGLEDTTPQAKRHKEYLDISENVKKMLIEVEVPTGSPVHGQPLVAIDFPSNALIAFIYRDKRYCTAHGKTKLQEHDKLLIMMNAKRDLKAIHRCLGITG